MKSLKNPLWCLFLLSANVFAQSGLRSDQPAATAPIFETSAGYTYISMNSPSTSRVGLMGVDGAATLHFTPRWGATLDVTYARTGSLPGIAHGDSLFSGLAGPVFYLKDGWRSSVFIHGLAGMGRVNSAVMLDSSTVYRGYETRFSYAFGGGYQRMISGPFGISIKGDYQRTTFLNSRLALEGRNNLRLTTGLIYRFGSGRW